MNKEPINYNQLVYMAKETCPDLIQIRAVISRDNGKWHVVEGKLLNKLSNQQKYFGRIVTARNTTKKYASLDSVRSDLIKACQPYHPSFVLHLEEE